MTLEIACILQTGMQDKVRLFSWDGDPMNLDYIAKGKVQAFTVGKCLEWTGWAKLEQLNRIFNGQKP